MRGQPISPERARKISLYLQYIAFVLERECPQPKRRKAQQVELEDQDRMMKWFEYAHLPEHLQAMSKPFGELAHTICLEASPGPERTVALRKLLEAKDAAVRAKLHAGG